MADTGESKKCGGLLHQISSGLLSAYQFASRRQLLLAAACATAAPTLTDCSSSDAEQSAARVLRSPGCSPPAGDFPHAQLGAASHLGAFKAQHAMLVISHCREAEKPITIAPDLTRRCPAVDPDDHHVFVSLGCAAENMVHAALATGRQADPRFDPSGDVGAIRPQFAAWLGITSQQRPDLVVRFGRGPTMPLSMRRPVQKVIL